MDGVYLGVSAVMVVVVLAVCVVSMLAITGFVLFLGLRSMRRRPATPEDLEYERRQRGERWWEPLKRDFYDPTPQGQARKLLRRINERLDEEDQRRQQSH